MRASPGDSPPMNVGQLTALIVLGGFMAGLDTSLVNVGLTSIAGDLHAVLANVQWVTSGYLLALAAALPACPWLQRRFGASRVWLVSLIAFAVASLLCALAPNLPMLIIARAAQGAAGGLLVPTGQKIIGSAVGLSRMGRVLSFAALALVLAPAIGPALGGLVIDAMSWRWLFAVNVPIGIVAVMLALRVLPKDVPDTAARLDMIGFGLLSTGLPALLLGLTHLDVSGPQTPLGVVLTVLGTVLLVAFVAQAVWRDASTGLAPLLDVGLFRRPSYATAQVTVFFAGISMFGGLILMPLYYEALRGLTAFDTGLLLLAYGAGAMVVLPIAGRLTDRIGGGMTCMIGLTITILATAPFVFLPADASLVPVELLQTLRGIGVGMTGIPAMTATFRAAPDHLTDATTTANILQRIGGSLGSAIIVIVVGGATPQLAEFQASHAILVATALLALVAAGGLTYFERRALSDCSPVPATTHRQAEPEGKIR